MLLIKDAYIPQGAWRRIFPQGRTLAQLRTLALSMYATGLLADEHPPDNAPQASLVDRHDRTLQRLVSCCPNLVSLSLADSLNPQQFDPLLRLTGLTHLCVPNADAAAAGVLLQLTRLSDLTLGRPQFDDLALLQFTTMTQLTSLSRIPRPRGWVGVPEWDGSVLALLNQVCVCS